MAVGNGVLSASTSEDLEPSPHCVCVRDSRQTSDLNVKGKAIEVRRVVLGELRILL